MQTPIALRYHRLFIFRFLPQCHDELQTLQRLRAPRRPARGHRRNWSAGCESGEKHQVLLGVTGSGKTFTMAKVIERANRPALVLAHNKTLAAQLYHEFKASSRRTPSNTSSAIMTTISRKPTCPPATPTSRRKPRSTTSSTSCGCAPRARFSSGATSSSLPVVSCIYGLGSPEAYYGMLVMLEKGQQHPARGTCSGGWWTSNTTAGEDLRRGTFRARGDTIEIYPPYEDNAYRIEMWGDRSMQSRQIDPITGEVRVQKARPRCRSILRRTTSMPRDQRERAIDTILSRARLVEAGSSRSRESTSRRSASTSAPCSTSR